MVEGFVHRPPTPLAARDHTVTALNAYLTCLSLALLASSTPAQSVTLGTTQDTSLYAEGALSNALGEHIFTGRTQGGNNRRALISFDVAGNVPAGATITSATLRLRASSSPFGGSAATVSIHRLTGAWSESTSDTDPQPGGAGDTAAAGDATWANRVHPGTSWASAGGDFVGAASASTVVPTTLTFYEWSGATVDVDVQGWLDTPASNFGWIVIGSEGSNRTARRFASREFPDSAFHPQLVIEYSVPAFPTFCDDSDGSLASCPCTNPGSPDTGCDIQQGTGGVGLDVAAQQTTPTNRITWSGTGFPAMSTPTSIVIRAATLDTGSPVVFGDGLRCVGVPLVRLAATFAAGGAATHTHGHGAMAGTGAFYYQLWFRNTPIMFCDPAAAFNLSNGRIVTW
jgi:hypothetical protein